MCGRDHIDWLVHADNQRFDSKRWKMLQIGTFFIRIYEKNITKWFTYEKWGSKLEVVGKKWN